MTDKKENKTDKKEKKNITEKIIKKIKTYSESIEDFLGGSDPETGVIGKKRIDKKQWGVEKKSSGGLITGKPKLAKRGWK